MEKTMTLKIHGMHCVSCAMNIDGELEDLGAQDVKTNYTKGECVVKFDDVVVSEEQMKAAIVGLGYTVE